MRKLFLFALGSVLFLVLGYSVLAQEIEDISAKTVLSRSRLNFRIVDPLDPYNENKSPTLQSIVIIDPEGKKDVYWYFFYEIINDTGRKLPWRGDIKIIIDKTREGVPEHKVPGMFYNAEIPQEKDGTYYWVFLEAKEGKKSVFWEVLLYLDVDNKLSLIEKRKLDINDPKKYVVPLTYSEKSPGPEISRRANFLSIDMNKKEDIEVAEITQMAKEILLKLHPDKDKIKFMVYNAAKQVGKEGTYYWLFLELDEGMEAGKKILWELLLLKGSSKKLSLIEERPLGVGNPAHLTSLKYSRNLLDPEIYERGDFLAIDMTKKDFDAAEIKQMAGEILPLINPAYLGIECTVHSAAKQIGLKEFNAPEVYVSRLRTYYDVDLPVVKNEILESLHLSPRLTPKENLILRALEPQKDKKEVSKTILDLIGTYYILVLEIQAKPKNVYWEVILREYMSDSEMICQREIQPDQYTIPRGFTLLDPKNEEISDKAKKGTINILEKGKCEFKEVHQAASLTLSYEEVEDTLVDLVVRKMVLPEEMPANSIFVEGRPDKKTDRYGFKFLKEEDGKIQEVVLNEGETEKIEGWEVVSYEVDPVEKTVSNLTMKKKGAATTFYPGASLEYLYTLSYRYYVENQDAFVSGMSAKGTYKGYTPTDPYKFENVVILPKEEHLFDVYLTTEHRQMLDKNNAAPVFQELFSKKGIELSKSAEIEAKEKNKWYVKHGENLYSVSRSRENLTVFQRHNNYKLLGLAIFPNLSYEMDFAAVVVSGLVDPIVWRQYYVKIPGRKVLETQRRGYVENEVYFISFKRPGDEFYNVDVPVEFICENWVILSRKVRQVPARAMED